MKPAGDHEMKNEEPFVGEMPHDSLSNPRHVEHGLVQECVQVGVYVAQEKWTANLDALQSLAGLGVGAGVKYAAARFLGGQGNYVDPDRWIYEASLFYRTRLFDRDTRVQVNVKNLEDEVYFWDRARYSPPINWRLTVSTHF